MLSSLKKTSDKSAADAMPAWHPNFRNFERLPDTKAVRTTFFTNGLAILVAVSLSIYVIYRETSLAALDLDIKAASEVVVANKPLSDQAIAQFKKFQEEEKKVADLQQFLAVSRLSFSDLMLQLGGSLPPAVTLSGVEYRPAGVTLKGSIKGSSEEGAGLAAAYVEDLKKNSYFSGMFDITLPGIVRDPATSQIHFEISMKFKAVAGGKK